MAVGLPYPVGNLLDVPPARAVSRFLEPPVFCFRGGWLLLLPSVLMFTLKVVVLVLFFMSICYVDSVQVVVEMWCSFMLSSASIVVVDYIVHVIVAAAAMAWCECWHAWEA